MFYLIQTISAFISTMFFSMLFQAAKRTLLLSGLCGMLGWLGFLLSMDFNGSLFFSSFIAALIVGLSSKICSALFNIPITNMLIPGIIPIVPGGLIYMAMAYIVANDITGFLNETKNTVIVGGSIALAIFFESTAFEKIPQYYRKMNIIRWVRRETSKIKAPCTVDACNINYRQLLRTAMTAGDILLRSGAEVFKVEEMINILCRITRVPSSESFVTPTGIFISIEKDDGEPITLVRRVSSRSINLSKIAEIDRILKEYADERISLSECCSLFEKVGKARGYAPILLVMAGGFAAAFFTILFKGNYIDALCGFFVGGTAQAGALYLKRNDMQDVIVHILSGVILAFIEVMISKVIPNNFDTVIMGSIMIFVPGVAITNAIREAITGDYVSSVTRGMEALVIAASIAIGIGIVLRLAY